MHTKIELCSCKQSRRTPVKIRTKEEKDCFTEKLGVRLRGGESTQILIIIVKHSERAEL